jgi:hypothetical protein
MSWIVYRINGVLSHLLSGVYIGTNLGLFWLLCMLLSGRLLSSRGAVIPGLAETGLPADAVRRAWAALCYGRWKTEGFLFAWQQLVQEEARFVSHRHGGFRPVACDLVGFFRPHLQDCSTKHYSGQARKALPAIPLGLLARIGSVGPQRLPLPCAFVRADAQAGEAALQTRLLQTARRVLAEDEALACDGGFTLSAVQAAGIERYVVRGPKNFTARRATPPAYAGRGRPATKGQIVRPLPRKHKGKTIAPTPADRTQTWREGEWRLQAEFWDNLVVKEATFQDRQTNAPTFTCVVIYDPRYQEPLLLNTPLPLSGPQARAFYLDRWPIEQLPLAAKQMLGAARQFVFAKESRQRLPELSLLAGAILMYVAATQQAVPTGFWDRCPKPTSGRLRRVLAQVHFDNFVPLPEQLRKKASPTAHLPKGVQAHRRQKRTTSTHNTQTGILNTA